MIFNLNNPFQFEKNKDVLHSVTIYEFTQEQKRNKK